MFDTTINRGDQWMRSDQSASTARHAAHGGNGCGSSASSPPPASTPRVPTREEVQLLELGIRPGSLEAIYHASR